MSLSTIFLILGILCIIIPLGIILYNSAMDKASEKALESVYLKVSEYLKEKKLAFERTDSFDEIVSILNTIDDALELEGHCKVSIFVFDIHYKEVFIYPLKNRLFAFPLLQRYNGIIDQNAFLSLKALVLYQLSNEIKRLKKNNLTY